MKEWPTVPVTKAALNNFFTITRLASSRFLKICVCWDSNPRPLHLDPVLFQNVRRVALVAFNSAAHNKPSLIRDLLRTVLPHLYNETQKRKELIREVGLALTY